MLASSRPHCSQETRFAGEQLWKVLVQVKPVEFIQQMMPIEQNKETVLSLYFSKLSPSGILLWL